MATIYKLYDIYGAKQIMGKPIKNIDVIVKG